MRRSSVATVAFAYAIVGVLAPDTVQAARFPNAVEKSFVFTGEPAATLAKLFGLSNATSSESLALGRVDAWAVYLLKQDTRQKITNGDGPPRHNLVRFTAGPVATLTISPFWMDLGTREPDPKPGYYSFTSPFVAESANDGWARLLSSLKNLPGWSPNGRPQFERCWESNNRELCVDVYGATDYASTPERSGYAISITTSG